MNKPLATLSTAPNPLHISALPSATLLDSHLMSTTTLRYRTSGLFKLNSRLTYLVAAKVTLTGKKCLQLAGYTNGSTPLTPSELSQAITFMMILANDNLVAPSFWVTGRSHLLSPLLGLTLLVWDAGFGLLYLVGSESLHVLSVLTILATPPLPTPTASGHSIAPTFSARMTPANLGWPCCMTLALPSQLGKQMEITSS